MATQDALPQMPSMTLDGKRALVTGASRGIGLAAAVALAGAGAHVTMLARGEEDLASAVETLREAGLQADGVTLDVRDLTAVRDVIGSAAPFDVLVNNAGTNRPRPFLEVSEDDFDAIVGLNLKAAFFVAQTVAARMAEAGNGGSIINVCSQMGHVGGRQRTVYCASKWALEGLTKSMALDLAPHQIRVNTICPTFTETPLAVPFFQDETFKADVLSRIKLGRLGRVEDLMGAFVFLAGDASAMMTGSSMVIDGGWTAD